MLFLKINVILFFICLSYYELTEGKQVLKIDRLDIIQIPEGSPVHLHYITINYTERTGSFISMDADLDRDFSGEKLHLELSIKRCNSREALDTCENFKKLKPSNFCHFMDMKGVAWTSFVYSYTPPFKCPFKKGKYIQKDGMFDPNTFMFFPISDYYWKVNSKFFDADEFLFEVYTELRVVTVQ